MAAQEAQRTLPLLVSTVMTVTGVKAGGKQTHVSCVH